MILWIQFHHQRNQAGPARHLCADKYPQYRPGLKIHHILERFARA